MLKKNKYTINKDFSCSVIFLMFHVGKIYLFLILIDYCFFSI